MAQSFQFYIITGYSGSGKSSALRFLEEFGFYCIDNLPSQMISSFLDLFKKNKSKKLAIVVDARSHDFLKNIEEDLAKLRQNYQFKVVFFECTLASITKRFKESRLKHPLADSGDIKQGYLLERKVLQHLHHEADITIDSSDQNVHQLKAQIQKTFGKDQKKSFEVFLTSFGFKHGMPLEADHVIDVRFLPNPYFEPSLRNKTGTSKTVQNFVLKQPQAKDFLKLALPYIKFLITQAKAEGKPFLNIAIGCTGGKHRSVTLVETLSQKLPKTLANYRKAHRDMKI